MRFREVDSNGDWTFGNGIQTYAKEDAALNLNIKTRLNSYVGDSFFDLRAGVDWKNYLSDPRSKDNLEFSIRNVLLDTEGVLRVNSIQSVIDDDREIQITYNIDTIFSTSFQAAFNIQPVEV